MSTEPKLYGLMAEFEHPEDLLSAARRAHEAGFRKLDAYSPFPVHGLSEALGLPKTRLPLLVLAAGIVGALLAFYGQYYLTVHYYPMNIGGRPLNSWPSYIVITFEVTVLFAGATAVFGMIALNGLPQPYHPIFNNERFGEALHSRFFLCIESIDEKFSESQTREFLMSLNPATVTEVRHDPREKEEGHHAH